MTDNIIDNLPSFEHKNSSDCFCNPRVFNICPECSDRESSECNFCGGKLPIVLHNYNEYPFRMRI